MKNVVDFPDSAAIDEEAVAWLVKLDSEQPLALAEREALGEWLHRSQAHRDRLLALANFWGKMNILTELAVPLSQSVQPPERRTTPKVHRATLTAIAATLLVSLTAGLTYWFQTQAVVDSKGVYATAIGERQSQTLTDGSVVMLNTNSQIRIDYDEHHRDVYLSHGEAHFVVAKKPDWPFRVHAGDGRIDAVGTAFSVYLTDGAVDVTVTEGVVALASISTVQSTRAQDSARSTVSSAIVDEKQLGRLKAGQVATIAKATAPELLSNVHEVELRDLRRRLSWTQGSLTFSGAQLKDVVREISRYTTVEIDFSEPAVGAIRVGGVFPVGETDAMFNALEQTFGLRVTRLSDDRVLVSADD